MSAPVASVPETCAPKPKQQKNAKSKEEKVVVDEKAFALHPTLEETEHILKWNFPRALGKFTLYGRSRACDATGFMIPELGWHLDGGVVAHPQKPEEIFITHSHTDHCHMLPHIKTRMKCPNVYLPRETEELVEAWLRASQAMTDNYRIQESEWTPAYTLKPVSDAKSFMIEKHKILCRVHRCDHSVPCVAFSFYQCRPKLKPEYAKLSGKEIGALRMQGTEVTAMVESPFFAFLGDTTHEIFTRYPDLLDMPVLIVECSFLEDTDRDQAVRTKHMLYTDLKPLIQSHPQTVFVLIHFSLRYERQDILDFFAKEALPNVVPWM